ncbi:hypothetical protein JTE90_014683 [Oedothorax gibbosus]|uniref:Sulfotransferase domain-containing protein n=1 Tax=Oedothorax gibbosus TaxID=931172 RepID=A0AAV6TT53_9ARAC|nr:hypothetical protein JTE90_014683 [Oedothorax gibbosus]
MYTARYLSERAKETTSENCRCKKCLDLPRRTMSTDSKPKVLPTYLQTDYGFLIPNMFSLEALQSAIDYTPRDDDLFIVTYPKCGTTWVQNIVACIYRKGRPFESAIEFLTSTPFLEMAGAEAARTMKRPGAIKLHLPFRVTPWSDKAKYIFVTRNPKDCCVSFYHHTKNVFAYMFQNGEFDDYFELFMEGKVDFGDYYDTLLSWYEHRNDPNVLFITYEQLKKDTTLYIMKIAEFMGEQYKTMLEGDPEMLANVIRYSSFDYMKQTLNSQLAQLAKLPKDFVANHPDIPPGLKNILTVGTEDKPFFNSDPNALTLVRKGVVGDWKNHLSPDQNRRMEERFRERTKGTDIPELWKDIMQ